MWMDISLVSLKMSAGSFIIAGWLELAVLVGCQEWLLLSFLTNCALLFEPFGLDYCEVWIIGVQLLWVVICICFCICMILLFELRVKIRARIGIEGVHVLLIFSIDILDVKMAMTVVIYWQVILHIRVGFRSVIIDRLSHHRLGIDVRVERLNLIVRLMCWQMGMWCWGLHILHANKVVVLLAR